MLSADRMEEFQSEEEEPWYDQQDLEQGKDGGPGDARVRERANPGEGRVGYLISGLYLVGKASASSCGGKSQLRCSKPPSWPRKV